MCSGIEAASVAWGPLGWAAAWFSEIERFSCRVLAHHYPTVPNLGDIRHIPSMLRAGALEAPDVLCGGTPCQSFSVAGLRRSLDDARGNLSLVFCETANALDDARETPCIVVWENVPGVLSTADNAFGCFLAGLAGEDDALQPAGRRWSNAGCVYGPRRTVAWRILDAQYFGLAQRRKRVFVVASARDDFDPAEVLFEWEGVRRDSAPSRSAGEGVAGTLAGGAAFGGNNTSGAIEVAAGLNTHGRYDFESETFIAFDARQDCVSSTERFGSLSCMSPQSQAVAAATGVRRLTPRECERLQGFPDDYTALGADGPRYRALGNSWPVPVITWIGRRIAAQLQ